ncbi:MAG: beta strand repeat-containing protein [Xylella fastidiosa subsp. multiplex]|uniref:beta strand repeat-containing protein n=1 Tax=Xylella fastidiosa TaxID=2371 RepID=UPI0003ECFE4F|nr:YadA-like family protein [Xylella fastidiosa]EWG14449.1 surface-exposed outer membrane protein [Xylella fastidiosa Mul-MD]
MKENQIYRKFWNLSLGSWSVASHMTNDGGCSDVVLRHSGVRNRSLVLAISLALTSVTHAQSVKGPAMVTASKVMVAHVDSQVNRTADRIPTGDGSELMTHMALDWKFFPFGNNSIAIGYLSKAFAPNAIALGYNSSVTQSANNGVALGSNSTVSGVNSVALGAGSIASEPNVVSVGGGDGVTGSAVRRIVNVGDGIGNNDAVNKSQLDGVTASVNDVAASVKTIALTNQVTGSSVASASGKESTAIGSGAQAVADNTAAFGGRAIANAVGASALGFDSHAKGINSTTVGTQSVSLGQGGVSLGYNSFVGEGSFNGLALGSNSLVLLQGVDSVALGSGSMASEPNVVSVGSGDGLRGPAVRRIVNVDDGIGNNDAVNKSQLDGVTASVKNIAGAIQVTGSGVASVSGQDSTAAGASAQAAGDSSVALGARSRANAIGSSALGVDGHAFGANSTALGGQSTAISEGGTSLGYNSFVAQSATNGIALGSNAIVSGVNSVALGAGSIASELNVISVGGGDGVTGPAVRRIVNVGDGIGNNDAVNKSQLDGVTASVNDVAASVKNIAGAIQITGSGVASVSRKDSTAAGASAQAAGDSSVALGTRATANAIGSIVLGVDSRARGVNSTALGRQSNAIGDGSVSLGFNSFVRQSGEHGVALGTDAGVSGKNSIALGYGSRTQEAEVLSIGSGNGRGGPATRRIVNVSSGNLSQVSTDAVNGGQLFQTLSSMASILGGGAAVGAQGVLVAPVYQIQGSSYGSVGAALKALDGKVTDIDHRVNVNSNLAAGAAASTLSASKPGSTSNTEVVGVAKVVSGAALSDSSVAANAQVLSKENGVSISATGGSAQSRDEVQTSSVGTDSLGSSLNARQATMAVDALVTQGVSKTQLDNSMAAANSYTDARFSALNDSFESLRSDVNGQMRRQDRRISRQGAMGAAMLNMATSAAGIHTQNRVGAGVGFQNGQAALSLGYQRAISDRSTVTIGGAFSSSDSSVGIGAGFGW